VEVEKIGGLGCTVQSKGGGVGRLSTASHTKVPKIGTHTIFTRHC